MPAKIFIVELDLEERTRLNALISKGKAPAKVILKARILLKADQAEGGPGWLDAGIVEVLDTNLTMVSRVRETFVTKGLDADRVRQHIRAQGAVPISPTNPTARSATAGRNPSTGSATTSSASSTS